LPFVSCAYKYAEQWTFPGGASDNRLYFEKSVTFAEALSELERMLLFDPQTSGGLLLCVPAEKLDDFMKQAYEKNQPAWHIGALVSGEGIEIVA
jgi:selenide,water dikinase